MNIGTKSAIKKIHILICALVMATSYSLRAENAAFEKVCQSCHTGGFKGWVSGAPNVNSKDNWKKFHERDSEAEMRNIVLNGLNDHEIKGGCSKCSDDEINSAIDYIILKTK